MTPVPLVFVVRMSAIGDVVMTTRTIAALRERGVEPVLVTSPGCADVARCMTPLRYFVTVEGTHIEAFEKDPGCLQGRPLPLTSLFFPDGNTPSLSVLDLQKTSRSRRARKALGTALKLANRAQSKPSRPLGPTTCVAKNTLFRVGLVVWAWLRSWVIGQRPLSSSTWKKSPREGHVGIHATQAKAVEKHLAKLRCLAPLAETQTLPMGSHMPSRLFHAEPLAQGQPLQANGQSLTPGRYICFVPGASGFVKQWPKEHFRALANLLFGSAQSGATTEAMCIVVLGGRNESFLGRYLAESPELTSHDIRDVTGALSLHETFRVLENAAHVFTNDTFASHVADLADVPATLFFGGTTPAFGFLPLSYKVSTLFQNLSCSPCTRHGLSRCRFGNLRCLRSITAEHALQTITENKNSRSP